MNATGNEQMKARRNPRIILFRLAQKCCHNDPDWSDSIIDPITSAGDANTMEFLTPALYARITGTAVELPNGTTYDYSHMEAIVNKTYDQYDSGTPETGVVNCITAICDAVYTDDSTAREFLQFIDDAIENVSDRTTLIGAYMNRVNSAVDAIDVQKENIVSANSSIKDADIAEESSNYIKYQILQQSTATLLSTANQTPSIALNLI